MRVPLEARACLALGRIGQTSRGRRAARPEAGVSTSESYRAVWEGKYGRHSEIQFKPNSIHCFFLLTAVYFVVKSGDYMGFVKTYISFSALCKKTCTKQSCVVKRVTLALKRRPPDRTCNELSNRNYSNAWVGISQGEALFDPRRSQKKKKGTSQTERPRGPTHSGEQKPLCCTPPLRPRRANTHGNDLRADTRQQEAFVVFSHRETGTVVKAVGVFRRASGQCLHFQF